MQVEIIPALMKEFGYKSIMQVPKLSKIVINQGIGQAVADKKLIDMAQEELTYDKRTKGCTDNVKERYFQFQTEEENANRGKGNAEEGKNV